MPGVESLVVQLLACVLELGGVALFVLLLLALVPAWRSLLRRPVRSLLRRGAAS